MTAHGIFGEAERIFDLRQAILLYAQRGSDVSAATVHDITGVSGKPALSEGRPITLAGVEKLAATLGRQIETCLLPENILSITMSQMIWWCPSASRRIWFRPEKADANREGLLKLNGKYVMHPPLVFAAGASSLRVNALADNKRPAADTQVYVAPYYNVDTDGDMCKGSAVLPRVVSPNLTAKYEEGFFGSAFSHSNYGHKLTRHPGNHLGLWREMQPRKGEFLVFGEKYLQPYEPKRTVLNFLKGPNDHY